MFDKPVGNQMNGRRENFRQDVVTQSRVSLLLCEMLSEPSEVSLMGEKLGGQNQIRIIVFLGS